MLEAESDPETSARIRVNDLTLKIATVNGTGSTSANAMLLKAIFRMGVPVSGKNLFPSNIQGLPSWYEIRVNKDGYTARSTCVDLVVALNAETYNKDVQEVRSGGYFVYDSSRPLHKDLIRVDVNFIGVPIAKLCVKRFAQPRERILMKNIVYVGVLAALLKIDMGILRSQLEQTFAKKKELMTSNLAALQLGFDHVRESVKAPISIVLKTMNGNSNNAMIIDGNSAAALGCLYAGATVATWYPITPSSSLMDAFTRFCNLHRTDSETGKKRFCIIQAEDELSAIGMVIGAGWNGARAFTTTSSPGISLMSEFIGLAYYAEIPAVIFDVQRIGPSTGMPTRTQQGDILMCAYASHGDTRHILLFPSSPEECFYLSVAAFDLAERFQTPVFVMSDLDIGMNQWICPKLEWDDHYKPERGKVLTAGQLEIMEEFYRYLDVDGDGVPYRTLPGTHPNGAFFTRGSGHNKYGRYTEESGEYREVMERLNRKYESVSTSLPEPVVRKRKGAKLGIVSCGSSDPAIIEAIDKLGHKKINVDYLRIRSFPFDSDVQDFLDAHDVVYVVEQNRDAQLRSLLVLETAVNKHKLLSILHYNGQSISSDVVMKGIVGGVGQ